MEKKLPKWFQPAPIPHWYKKHSKNFREYFKQQLFVDMLFHCQNNEVIGGHKLIFFLASPLFRNLLSKSEECFYNEDNIIHISMPEVSRELMSDFIESVYLGAVPTCQKSFHEYQVCFIFAFKLI